MPTQLVPGVIDMIERINRFVRDVTPDDLRQIPPDRRWTVFINGHEYLHQEIQSVVLASRFAVIKLGITNAGTYHVRIGEYGGGGGQYSSFYYPRRTTSRRTPSPETRYNYSTY